MHESETSGWRDKLSADGIRQLEYVRRTKDFYARVPGTVPAMFEFGLSGGLQEFLRFNNETADLTSARPEHYEEVEVSKKFVRLIKSLKFGEPWSNLTPGVKRFSPGHANFIRRFQSLVLQFESDPKSRATAYLLISLAVSLFGDLVESKIQEVAEKSNGIEEQGKRTTQVIKDLGKIVENLGRTLQGKSVPKGKRDTEKIKMINLIRKNEIQKLSWDEMFAALKFAGIYFPNAESLKVFSHRYKCGKSKG